MRTKLRSKISLLFLTIAVLLAVPAVAALAQDTGTSPAPTIQSDKADYAPGELVTLTGSGWQAGELVNIKVNDDAGQTWSRNVDVVADSSGNISDSFNLPNWFVATYSVTATGAQSGVATTTFTDGSIDVRAQAATTTGTTNLAVPFPVNSVKRFNSTDCTGSAASSNASQFTTLTNGSYTVSGVSAQGNASSSNQSATITAPSTFTSSGTTYNFKNLTTVTGGVTISPTGCITRSSGTANPAWQMTANYVVAPQVTSINRVDASPTNAASVSWTVKFSQSVTGVDAGDFDLANTGLTDPGPINVTGSGDTYTVTASTGSGNGSLGLNLDDDNSIIAGAGNPLGGTVDGNGSFTGQVYTIDKTAPTVTIISTNPDTLEETGSSIIKWKANETGTYSVRVGGTDCSTGQGTEVDSGNYTTADTEVQTTVDAADLAEGSNTIRICVTDAATNVGSSTTMITKNLIRQTTTTLTQTAGTNPSTYGDSVTFTATVTASAGNPSGVGTVDFKDGSTVICNDMALAPGGNTATCSPSLNAGSYNLTAEYSGFTSGSPRFSASTSSPALSHTVNKKELTVTAANKTITYGQDDPSFTFTYSGGFVGTDTAADIDTPPTCGVSVAHSGAGSYDITCSGGLDNNYKFTFVKGTLTVEKKELTVTADNKTITLGQDDPSFTFTYSGGFVGTDTAADIDTPPTCGVSVTHTNVGSYPIVCSGGSDNNYKFTFVNGALKIIYNFDGFRQPVDMKDMDGNYIFNAAKAGQSIPIKFSLFGNQGLNILQPSTQAAPNPKVTAVTCPGSSTLVDQIEQTTTANNGLTYDATIDQYNYVWKTQSSYSTKCFKFDMVLIDGTSHVAYFKFTK